MANQSDVAGHLFLDQSTVSKLIASGILPRASRGALDLDACRNAYIRHLRDAAAGRGAASDEDNGQLTAERVRYARAQADALEMKNDLAAGRVAPIDVTAAMVGALLASVRTRLLAIPLTVAPALSRCKTVGEQAAVLTKHIHHALEELSRGSTDDPRSNPDPDGRGAGEGAEDVGGPAVLGKRARGKRRGQGQG